MQGQDSIVPSEVRLHCQQKQMPIRPIVANKVNNKCIHKLHRQGRNDHIRSTKVEGQTLARAQLLPLFSMRD